MMEMDELASQLRMPHGEKSKEVTDLMATGNKSLYKFAFDDLNLFPEATVLEVGPANGYFVKDLFESEESIAYIGLDLSHDMIRMANETNQTLVKQGRAKFTYGDVTALPFEDETFDRIFTVNTLYFWSDTAKGMSELLRVLKKSGKLFIIIRSKESMEKMPFTQFGFRLYSRSDLTELIHDHQSNSMISSRTEVIELPNGVKTEMVSFCAMVEKQ